jgi:hypothetical protein
VQICYTDQQGYTQCYWNENVSQETNVDRFPKTKVFFGLQAEYGFRVGNRFEISPFVSFVLNRYLQTGYTPLQRNPGESYPMGNQPGYEGGVNLSFVTSSFGALVASASYFHLPFRPEGYFENIPHANLKSANAGGRFGIGYQFFIR